MDYRYATAFCTKSSAAASAAKPAADASKIMVRLDSRVRSVDKKIDYLTKRPAKLSLIVKKASE